MDLVDYTGRNLVFIVGSPRSGTTWLQQLLASYPRAKTGPESTLFLNFIGPQLRVWRNELDLRLKKMSENPKDRGGVGLGCYFREDEFMRNLKQYLFVLLQPMIGNLSHDEYFIEKTPSHALYIPEIVQMLPNCKIVHILRDARDVVASLLAISKGWGKNWAPTDAAKAAKTWTNHVLAVKTAAKDLSASHFYQIRYEALRNSPETELLEMSKFLQWNWDRDSMIDAISRNDSVKAKTAATPIPMRGELQHILGRSTVMEHGFVRKAKVGSWQKDLSLKQKLDVWRVAHKTMSEVGYPWKYPW